MSALINCHNVAKGWSTGALFEQLDFSVQEGDRIGIFGPNGAGKSTLLKMLARQEVPDSGQISWKKGIRVAYVAQQSNFDPQASVRQLTSAFAEHEAMALLNRFGCADLNQAVGSLSGGQTKRLAICMALLEKPDLLLLDEPTNHLDWRGIAWLEDLLLNQVKTWICISHDRYFLNRTARKIMELNKVYPQGILSFPGNYERFLELRREYLEGMASSRDSLANKVRREEEWLRQGVKARTTKSRSRIQEAERLIDELGNLQRKLRNHELEINFSGSDRKSKQLAVMSQVSHNFGEKPLFENIDGVVTSTMRLGILGWNGTGKTTLLKILKGELSPSAGGIKWAPDLKIQYFAQQRDFIPEQWTLKRALCEDPSQPSTQGAADQVLYQNKSVHVAAWARRFQFDPIRLDTLFARLSGGEKARVHIAHLVRHVADVLMLDEPTNDLDITTLEVLEESLIEFPGALLIVSHDRWFLQQVCNIYLGLHGDGSWAWYASYEQWEDVVLKKSKPTKSSKEAKLSTTESGGNQAPVKKVKLSYAEQREFDGIEKAIALSEEKATSLQKQLDDPKLASQASKLLELSTELDDAYTETARLYARWADLEAKQQG